MNRDEVNAMTDAELRSVAIILRDHGPIAIAVDREKGIFVGLNNETYYVSLDALEIEPDYCNDIAAALELAKLEPITWSWLARLIDERPGSRRYMIYNVMPKATPKNITSAFILAMTSKEDGDE